MKNQIVDESNPARITITGDTKTVIANGERPVGGGDGSFWRRGCGDTGKSEDGPENVRASVASPPRAAVGTVRQIATAADEDVHACR